MLTTLSQKALDWTPELADQFHNNVPRIHPRKGGYIWTVEENGFYHYGPDAVDFYRHDGRVFSVQKIPHEWNATDWRVHQWMAEQSRMGEFRISIPIMYVDLTLKGEEWVYTEIQYPGYEIGYPGNALDIVMNDAETTIKEYIDSMTVLIKYFDEIHDEINCGYPSKVKIGNRVLDSYGKFWKDIKYWSHDKDSFLRKHVGEVQKIMNRLPHNNIKVETDFVQYCREQWNYHLDI